MSSAHQNAYDELKRAVAREALRYVVEGDMVGVGTGSTANFFIEELATIKDRIRGAVASSEATVARCRHHDIDVFDLNQVATLPVYIDGADEITSRGVMIKGGGGALTREKIVASVAQQFICIVDDSKLVNELGQFPLPVEVIPMAQAAVARALVKLGGEPRLRFKDGKPMITDNGCVIIDLLGLKITDFSHAVTLETSMNQIPGVLTVGLFARRHADVCLLGTTEGVKTMNFLKHDEP